MERSNVGFSLDFFEDGHRSVVRAGRFRRIRRAGSRRSTTLISLSLHPLAGSSERFRRGQVRI
jgi:hypothetical protein